MSFEVKRPVFAHDFLNPPAEDRTCDINIKLINPSGAINLTKESPGIQTRYRLTVSDSSLIGLNSSDQGSIERAIKDLILSFNLCLMRSCLSTLSGELPSAEIKFLPKETKVTIKDTPNGKHITIHDTVRITDRVSIRLGSHDELDEKQALLNLEKIIEVNRFNPKETTPLKVLSLGKALNAYERAMSTFDRMQTFKNLYNTLEFCANWNGVDHTGPALDSLIASISPVSQADFRSWRRFNARTKHVDRTPREASRFVKGMEMLSSILPPIREAAKQLIIDRLNQN